MAEGETETEEVEAFPATKPQGSAEATTVVATATETGIVIATEIAAVIDMVTGTVIEVVILAPGTESKRHQRSVPD